MPFPGPYVFSELAREERRVTGEESKGTDHYFFLERVGGTGLDLNVFFLSVVHDFIGGQ